MSETTPERPAVLGRRGEAECVRARTSLAEGRHADALAAVRRARRLRPAQEAPGLALAEADALLGLLRYREAVVVATRALRRGLDHDDVEARLRVVRGHGLWLTGRRAGPTARCARPRSRPRRPSRAPACSRSRASSPGRRNDREAALAHLAQAEQIYLAADCPLGTARVLEKRAGHPARRGATRGGAAPAGAPHRGRGRLRVARTCWPSPAAGAPSLLAALGRWEEARREFDASAALFREKGDAREFTVAEAGRAAVDVATGDLGRARAALERARDLHADRGNTRSLAETLLRVSDLHLASGEADVAERIAVEALGLYRLLQDARGRVPQPRAPRARAGRRCAASPKRCGKDAGPAGRPRAAAATSPAFALLALGRALLRVDRREAGTSSSGRAPQRRAGPATSRPPIWASPARAASIPTATRCAQALAGLRGLGRPPRAGLRAWPTCARSCGRARRRPRRRGRAGRAAAGARALGGGGRGGGCWSTEPAPVARWAAVMRALGAVLPWWRAVLVAESGWELRRDVAEPRPLAAATWRGRSRANRRARVSSTSAGDGWDREPSRVLHGLDRARSWPRWRRGRRSTSTFAPRTGRPPDETGLALLAEFVRLLGLRPLELLAPEDRAIDEDVPGIIGRCPAMRETLRTMARVAPSDLVVHVCGETGTGKERVAEALHARSRPARAASCAVNASSLSDELFESEMFGHVRGAFTGRGGGARRLRGRGRGRDALPGRGGRSVRRARRRSCCASWRRASTGGWGRRRLRKADVRAGDRGQRAPRIAGCAPDLIFRLEDVVLALPPLRERGDDLWLPGARSSCGEAARRGAARCPIADRRRPARCSSRYAWPGNVRELQREIQRAVVLSGGAGHPAASTCRVRGGSPASAPRGRCRTPCSAFEREHVARGPRAPRRATARAPPSRWASRARRWSPRSRAARAMRRRARARPR